MTAFGRVFNLSSDAKPTIEKLGRSLWPTPIVGLPTFDFAPNSLSHLRIDHKAPVGDSESLDLKVDGIGLRIAPRGL